MGQRSKPHRPENGPCLAVCCLRAMMSLTEGRRHATASCLPGKVLQAIGHVIDGRRGQGQGYGGKWEGHRQGGDPCLRSASGLFSFGANSLDDTRTPPPVLRFLVLSVISIFFMPLISRFYSPDSVLLKRMRFPSYATS